MPTSPSSREPNRREPNRRGASPQNARGAEARRAPRRGQHPSGTNHTRGDRTPRSRTPRGPRSPKPLTPEQLAARRAALPTITYPPQLPVSARRDDIAAAIAAHQVVVVAGETGSGKTTQLPKICLELGRGIAGTIGHTQPRRIAARSVADRIADELGVTLGGAVGYQVRFTDQVGPTTLVKVMTDGILLAEIQRDPELRRYDTIIVDEAHERSLNIDFILGYLRRLLPQRPDLKVVITSATIETDRFARHFALDAEGQVLPWDHAAPPPQGRPCPVIEVSGRTFPVEIRYRPLVADDRADTDSDDDASPTALGPATQGPATRRHGVESEDVDPDRDSDIDQPTAIVNAVAELMRDTDGDILVFCSGEREIRDATDALRDGLGPRFTAPGATSTTPGAVEVLPLYARLSAAEQHRVFERHRYRRVVIATNVAETSLTVPGIHAVVDTGYARISRYSTRTKVQRLPIEPISQASANQRSGRCGRVADGVAIRLYSATDYARRPEFTEPEILRTSLASVILQMAALGLGRMDRFPFVEAPALRAVRDGVALLTELGAITELPPREGEDADVRLTGVGRRLAELPIDPRLGRMLLEADRLGVVEEVLVIVAALSVQDVRERPSDKREQADASHRRFAHPDSDVLALVTLWDYLTDQRSVMGSSAFRRACRAEYLHFLRIREWQDVHAQLRQLASSLGIRRGDRPELDGVPEAGVVRRRRIDADGVHQAVLAGLLSHIGSWDERRREYAGARGARFVPFPGSTLAKRPPAFVMAAELVETSRLFARTCARIKPEWAETLGAHLVKHTYSEPYWSSKQGAAMCHEKVLLFGVTLVADRIVPFARVSPELAREMFIRHALVEDDWRTHHRIAAQNRELREQAADLAERTRRLDLLADDEALFDFFDDRLPASVTTARAFDAWWKDARRTTPDLLRYSLDLLVPGHAGVDTSGLPEAWRQVLAAAADGASDLELPLTYSFTPGHEADGVTVHVPIAVLPRLRPEGFDWLVPALLPELTTATIRALPKPVRVQLVPAPDTAAAVGEVLPEWSEVAPAPPGAPSFHEAFAAAVAQVRGVVIPPDAFTEVAEKLPAHLRMTFRVVGERGAVLGESPDLAHLQRRLAAQSQQAVQHAVRRALREAGGGAGGGARAAKPRAPQADGASAGSGGAGAAGLITSGALERDRVACWEDLAGASIPQRVRTVVGGLEVTGYPSLVAEGDHVALRVLADAERAQVEHAAGVRALLLAELALPEARITSRWTGREALLLASSPYRSTTALVTDVQAAAISRLTQATSLLDVRDDVAYRTLRSDVRDALEDTAYWVVARVVEALAAHRELEALVRRTTSMALLATLQQVREHAAHLVRPGFVASTPPGRLPDLARYLRADAARLEAAERNPGRDATLAWELDQTASAVEAVDAPTLSPLRRARVAEIRWQLEELRVSLFAQQVGAREKVSAQRIRKALAAV